MKNIIFLAIAFYGLLACNNTPQENSKEEVQPQKKEVITNLDKMNAHLEKNPNDAEAYLNRAEYYLRGGTLQEASNDIYRALQIDSSLAKAHELKGEIFFAKSQSGRAKKEWDACVRLDKNNIACREKLAELYIAVQNYEKALELINEAIAIDEQKASPYFMKGIIVRDFYQDTTMALRYFQKAVDMKQDFVEALDMMGVMLAEMGDTSAKYYYQRILEMQPKNADVHYKLGHFYMQQDDVNKAFEYFTKATIINPKDAESYFNLGYLQVGLRQFGEARDLFTKAIQVKELNYKAYYGRGYCFEMLGDVINAEKDYKKAIECNPAYTPAKESLQRLYRTNANQ